MKEKAPKGNYIDAWRDPNDRVWVSERMPDGTRRIRSTLPRYVFYYRDPGGLMRDMWGEPVKRFATTDRREFYREVKRRKERGETLYESDTDVVYRYLEENYPEDVGPDLRVAFYDIEVDKDPKRPYARPENAYGIINAITVRLEWEQQTFTLLVPPPGMSMQIARTLLDGGLHQDEDGHPTHQKIDAFGAMPESDGYILFETEAELLLGFLELIRDADVLCGYNSDWFDLPYIISRIRIIFGGESIAGMLHEDGSRNAPQAPTEASREVLEQLCLFPCIPTLRMGERFGKKEKTYFLHGRISVDFLALYRKFKLGERHSYSLDSVLRDEVGQQKVAYTGSLDQLYRQQFRTFAAYSRQDVEGLAALDRKLKFIQLGNSMAHTSGVTFDKVTGSVVKIERAVIKELHKQGMVVQDREEQKIGQHKAPGAYVVTGARGRYRHVSSYDMTSLYPNIIRALNISPETLIGQFRLDRTEQRYERAYEIELAGRETESAREDAAKNAWKYFVGVIEFHMIQDETDDVLTLDLHGGESISMTAREWKKVLLEQNWGISANATVFDMNREGIIPFCLAKWFSNRAANKDKAQKYYEKASKEDDPDKKKEYLDLASYYNITQEANKVYLNSTYGALLNLYFVFHDERLGRSVTLSGRCITKHMAYTLDDIVENRVPDMWRAFGVKS